MISSTLDGNNLLTTHLDNDFNNFINDDKKFKSCFINLICEWGSMVETTFENV